MNPLTTLTWKANSSLWLLDNLTHLLVSYLHGTFGEHSLSSLNLIWEHWWISYCSPAYLVDKKNRFDALKVLIWLYLHFFELISWDHINILLCSLEMARESIYNTIYMFSSSYYNNCSRYYLRVNRAVYKHQNLVWFIDFGGKKW